MTLNTSYFNQQNSLEFIARQVVEGFITGLHKSPFHGFSVEFAEHRLYNTGESTKHIDWKLFARTDRLFVKRYEEETNLRCQIIIDASSSMYYPNSKNESLDKLNKMGFAVYSAAALVYLLKKQRDAFGLSVFTDKIDINTQVKSSSVHQQLIYSYLSNLLEKEQTRQSTKISENLHQIADTIHKRSLVIIFSDMLETGSEIENQSLYAALQHLKYNKHEVVLFHIFDKETEFDFNLPNRPHRFVDMESGDELKLNPHSVKEIYEKRIKNYREQLKLKCAQYQIDFVPVEVSGDFHQILNSYLIKRTQMK